MKCTLKSYFLCGVLFALLGCSGEGSDGVAAVPRVNIPFTPDISINEIMVAQIDHAAHFIWDTPGMDVPDDDYGWERIEHHAIQLISSRSALSMGGSGVNDAMWIAQPSWREYVNLMNVASLLALDSARAKDMEGLRRAGDLLVDSCESCHRQYKPSIPTEGLVHPHSNLRSGN